MNVQDVVRELEVPDEATVYLNENTGEFVLVTDELEGALDRDIKDVPEWERDLLPKIKEALESEHCIPLPDRFEIHEWSIMQDFSESQSDPEISARLLDAIHGPGAFRFFKAELRNIRLDNAWYSFRENAFQQIAIQWLDENGIPYEH